MAKKTKTLAKVIPLRGTPTNETLAKQGFLNSEEHPDTNPDTTKPRALTINKKFVMRLEPFTQPKIYKGKNDWFIHFWYLNPATNINERFRIRGGINYEKDLHKREILANMLRRELSKQLKAGKVPNKYIEAMELPPDPVVEKLKLIPELERVSKSYGLGKSQDTRNAYRLMIGRLTKYLGSINNKEMLLHDFNGDRAQEFKEYMIEEMELKNVTVNCTIQPIKSFLEDMFVRKVIDMNPFYSVKYLPKHRGSTFIAFDHDEKKAIADELKRNYPELYLFVNLIYSCFSRPKENCALVVKDFDMHNDWLQIRTETSKVSHTSYRQIMPGLRDLILEYQILSMPKNQLVFESICGKDNNLRARRRRVTDLWKAVVKKKLGIEKEMYGMKHTGNIDYLKSLPTVADANLLFLKQQNDHTTLETTQNYIRDLGVYKMKKENLPFGVL